MQQPLEKIKDTVITGKHKEIEALVKSAIQSGRALDEIINQGLIAAMDVVGERFGKGEIFVPEMLVSAMTMKKGLNIVKPLLQQHEDQSSGKVVLCTVKGDLHDIGKNLVAMMLEGAGFEVVDLGVDATVESVIATTRKVQADIIGLSALLTTTMPEMEKVIQELKNQELRESVKVMIGGAPISAGFADKIGADAYGIDAAEAVVIARRLVAR